jgi:TolB-like protein/DNA-binding winged helix-turn-helix (wHTH) protein
MDTASPTQLGAIRFGVFEVDLRAGELRKQGVKVKLQEQPLQVLQVLLEKPGEIVTREELRKRIWPSDTFVDFDGGVNNAIKRLREALGDKAETPRFIETLPRRGYRFIGTVNGSAPSKPVNGPLPTAESHPEPPASRRTPHRGILIGLGFAALFLVIVEFTPNKWWQHLRGTGAVPQIRSIAVLPLQNLSGDPSQEYFADAMTEELITELSRIRALKVISRTSVMRFKSTNEPLPEIARALGVDGIVEGSVLRSGDRVRITAQLIYAAKDTNLWAETYDRDLQDVLTLQGTVATAIAREIKAEVTPQENLQLRNLRPVNRKAVDAYLDGRYHFDKALRLEFHKGMENQYEGELQKAMAAFELAVQLDPGYAAAYLGIHDVGSSGGIVPHRGLIPKARAALQKALGLDDSLVQAHLDRAMDLMTEDWNWAGAEKEYKRALELNPNSPEAHMLYSNYLEAMSPGSGQLEGEIAQELDPEHHRYSLSGYFPADWSLDQARDYLDQKDPGNAEFRTELGKEFQIVGRYKEAVEQYIKAVHMYGYHDMARILEQGYARGDYKGAIRDWMKKWDALSKRQHLPTFWAAFMYANLGDKDAAFAWLGKAYQEHDWCILWLKNDPIWDPIRSDPRFKDLLRRVSLPP